MKNLYYYRQEEAEKIRLTYQSWIGKEAHIGKGRKDRLKAIHITPRGSHKKTVASDACFSVEFEFEHKRFSAQEFFFHNSLNIAEQQHPYINPAKNLYI